MPLPTISLERTSVVEENYGYVLVSFRVSISEPSADEITFGYRTLYGTSEEADFSGALGVGTGTILAGDTSTLITVRVNGDRLDEADESFFLEVFNPFNATLEGKENFLRATGIIEDNDGSGLRPSLFVADAVVAESQGIRYATFDVSLSRAAAEPLSFTYRTVNGSATAGTDYAASNGVVTFEAGQTTASVRVAINGDSSIEADEFFSLVVDAGSQVENGFAASTGMATIRDDDTARGKSPILSVERFAATEVNYGYLACTFKVSVTKASADEISFDYRALAGTAAAEDFSGGFPARTGTIEAGQTTAFVTLYVRGDRLDEVDESVFLEVSNVKNAAIAGGEASSRTIGIVRDEDGSGSNLALFVNDAVVTEGADGSRFATFEVHLSRPHEEPLEFKYKTVDDTAKSKSDYVAESGTVTFAAGQTVAAVQVRVNGDQVLEQNEQFSLVLTPTSAIKNGTLGSTGRARIINDDTIDEVIHGTGSSNRISGKDGNDKIYGLGGNDSLSGDDGKDRLYGGSGDDRLAGGKGADKLYGGSDKNGSGNDTFVFKKSSHSTVKSSGQDTIYDFSKGDRFDLSAIDANSRKGGNQAFSFIGSDKFDGKAGELRFEKKNSDTYVYADVNGDKKADFAFHLDDAVKLVKADFLL